YASWARTPWYRVACVGGVDVACWCFAVYAGSCAGFVRFRAVDFMAALFGRYYPLSFLMPVFFRSCDGAVLWLVSLFVWTAQFCVSLICSCDGAVSGIGSANNRCGPVGTTRAGNLALPGPGANSRPRTAGCP